MSSETSSLICQPNTDIPLFESHDDPRRRDRVQRITVHRRPTQTSVAFCRMFGFFSANIAILTKWRLPFWLALLSTLVSKSRERVTEKSRINPYLWAWIAMACGAVYFPWTPSILSLLFDV